MLRRLLVIGLGWGLLGGLPVGAHEDVINGPRGAERTEDALIGQGRNSGKDQAYAHWAQYEDNLTEVLDLPLGQPWISVADAIPFAKRVWGVNILDETGGAPALLARKFLLAAGPVEREMALPLFLQALEAAVEGAEGFYVVREDDGAGRSGFRNYHKAKVYLRRARPLQPDYDHPGNVDEQAIAKLEAQLAATPRLDDRQTAPQGRAGQKCADCQAEVARLVAAYQAQGGMAAVNGAECRAAIAAVPSQCRHCRRYEFHRRNQPDPSAILAPESVPAQPVPVPVQP